MTDAALMPYSAERTHHRSLHARERLDGNQTQPLLLSSAGRYVWSEAAFAFAIQEGELQLRENDAPLVIETAGRTLDSAFRAASRRFFPADGRIPAHELFTSPQYNTWIELLYDQNESRILDYAKALLRAGYPQGVLMIDDNWQEDYGVWHFSPRRFQDPRGLIQELHRLGFRVMLWVCPFVSADSATFRELARRGLLLRDASAEGDPVWNETPNDAALVRWWNGASGVLDLSHPEAVAWFRAQLDRLVNEFGVDGFKFDAGDSHFYLPARGTGPLVSHQPRTPEEHTLDFARIGLSYPFNEYRACWRLAGQPLAQRLRDKEHAWSALQSLVPGIIAQGLMGYAFTCPDLIGGGHAGSFENPATFDPELVVRSAQVHALMPMMQFSVAPWRVLPPALDAICRQAAHLHQRAGAHLLSLAREAAQSGEPIIRPLAWHWPHAGYEEITDTFLVGSTLLVAPVVQKHTRARDICFPPGIWHGDDGTQVQGPVKRQVDVPLERLPYYSTDASLIRLLQPRRL